MEKSEGGWSFSLTSNCHRSRSLPTFRASIFSLGTELEEGRKEKKKNWRSIFRNQLMEPGWGATVPVRSLPPCFWLLSGDTWLLLTCYLKLAATDGWELGAGSVRDGHLSELRGVPHITHQGEKEEIVFHALRGVTHTVGPRVSRVLVHNAASKLKKLPEVASCEIWVSGQHHRFSHVYWLLNSDVWVKIFWIWSQIFVFLRGAKTGILLLILLCTTVPFLTLWSQVFGFWCHWRSVVWFVFGYFMAVQQTLTRYFVIKLSWWTY